jgi:DNA polymerase-3 subunit alpha
MHGEEAVTYRHPLLEPIFKETYGYPVYQEQLMFAVMQLGGYTAPEADDLRKAVSKKIKEKLLKHREKFIAGAIKNEISEQTAAAIFDDWEEFARYGFNKAHAADYGVIAVQTAYLKTHFPVEYMTALLSVTQSETEKVAFYVADCRRMGIRVEPPDVNASGWDFTIEDHPDGTSTIRFGLGAVKNVGHGPVDAILSGRADHPFQDLNDFAHRVDLRLVGKRALESLVRVGALDDFAPRTALLEGLDRIISVSAAHFRAKESGQLSLFGAHTGIIETIILPPVVAEISRREILNWERELIGLYVSDHPLNPVMNELTQAVTHFSGQLHEAAHEEHVRVAGMITRIRHHQTKTGKSMAFVALEDLQGIIELVVFPKVWDRLADVIDYDRIVLVDGRVDNQGSEPKLLVDNITTDFSLIVSTDGLPSKTPPTAPPPRLNGEDAPGNLDDLPRDKPGASLPPSQPRPARRDANMDDLPPPPEEFPADWVALEANTTNLGILAAMVFAESLPGSADNPPAAVDIALVDRGQEAVSESGGFPADRLAVAPAAALPVAAAAIDSVSPAKDDPLPPVSDEVSGALNAGSAEANEPGLLSDAAEPVLGVVQQYFVSPGQSEPGEIVHMITIVLRSSGDKTRDVLRLRRIHGTVMSYPGKDRFAFHVFERGRGYLVEFPNFTTGLCPELISRLRLLVGADQVRIEPITFQ